MYHTNTATMFRISGWHIDVCIFRTIYYNNYTYNNLFIDLLFNIYLLNVLIITIVIIQRLYYY